MLKWSPGTRLHAACALRSKLLIRAAVGTASPDTAIGAAAGDAKASTDGDARPRASDAKVEVLVDRPMHDHATAIAKASRSPVGSSDAPQSPGTKHNFVGSSGAPLAQGTEQRGPAPSPSPSLRSEPCQCIGHCCTHGHQHGTNWACPMTSSGAAWEQVLRSMLLSRGGMWAPKKRLCHILPDGRSYLRRAGGTSSVRPRRQELHRAISAVRRLSLR